MKEKTQPRTVYPAKLSFRNGERDFPKQAKAEEFIMTRPVLQEAKRR